MRKKLQIRSYSLTCMYIFYKPKWIWLNTIYCLSKCCSRLGEGGIYSLDWATRFQSKINQGKRALFRFFGKNVCSRRKIFIGWRKNKLPIRIISWLFRIENSFQMSSLLRLTPNINSANNVKNSLNNRENTEWCIDFK